MYGVWSRTENLKKQWQHIFVNHKSHIDVIHFHICETSQGTGPHFPAEVGTTSVFTCLPNDPGDSYSRDSQDLWKEQGRWQAGFLRWCDSPSVSFHPLVAGESQSDRTQSRPPSSGMGWGPGQHRGGGWGSGLSSSLLSQQDLRLLLWLSSHFLVATAPQHQGDEVAASRVDLLPFSYSLWGQF